MDDALLSDGGDMTAAELSLGLLDGAERAAALRRVLAEPDFARDVEAWRLHFAQLFDLWPGVEVPEGLVDRIDESLGGPVTGRRSRMPWPAIAIVASAIAAVLLVMLLVRPLAPPPPVSQPVPVAAAPAGPILIASLGDAKAPIAAAYDPAAGSIRVAATPAQTGRKVAELWLIGGDGVPHALGLLTVQPTTIGLPAAARAKMGSGMTLAISVEPAGGAPGIAPTGPVIATGVLAAV
ncbi:anti-sigma factor domain-containing protein [Sphingomonas bacterium]|uniref:anti-sigma factor n=1 Tax=Sphingomonas bacterium TaxID=1895847 RepID=UPI0015768C17|nr:anti-sigma factor [Sphingomonas bacterium]